MNTDLGVVGIDILDRVETTSAEALERKKESRTLIGSCLKAAASDEIH